MLDNFDYQHFRGDFKRANDIVGLPTSWFSLSRGFDDKLSFRVKNLLLVVFLMLFNALLFLTKS